MSAGATAVRVGLGIMAAGVLATACSGPRSRPPATRRAGPARVPSTTTHPVLPAAPAPGADATSEYLATVALFNPEDGFGLYMSEGPVGCQALVGPTTDGGATFGPLVAVASWQCGAPAPVGSLAFDDHGDGFAYGPELYVTHDDGRSWTRDTVQQYGDVLDVAALGASVWMLEGCPPGSPPGPCSMSMLQSSDGGSTWLEARGTPPLPTYTAPASAGQTWLVRTSQTTAYWVSTPATNGEGVDDSAPLWFTDDGGATWSVRQIPCEMDASSVALSVAPDGTLIAVCAGEPGAGQQLKSVVRSFDGGSTWTTEFSCPVPGAGSAAGCESATLMEGYLGSIDAVSGETVFLVGGRSSLLVTHDGGASWQPTASPIGSTAGGTQQVIFFTPSAGVVVGDDDNNNERLSIWHTANGGETWMAIVPRAE
jgi:photosystem II stability/assembly factor-like uncharacterized protein